MEDYVTFEQAVKLKELGFDWECNHYYQDNDQSLHPNFYENFNKHSKLITDDEKLIKVTLYSAPTLSQAQKWLREVKRIYVEISRYHLNNFAYELKFDYDSNHRYCCQGFMTPEDALSKGIDATLELLK